MDQNKNGFKAALENYLKSMEMQAVPVDVGHLLSAGTEEGLANAFNIAMKHYQMEEIMPALASLLAILEFVNRKPDLLAADELLGYHLDIASIAGHIFWDEDEVEQALAAFQYGIHLVEEFVEDITQVELDPHEINDASILYIIEDYASLCYALDKRDEAKKYYELLQKLDRHNHLNADVALECLENGVSWDDAVDRLDAASGDEECDEECDEGCQCGEHTGACSDEEEHV